MFLNYYLKLRKIPISLNYSLELSKLRWRVVQMRRLRRMCKLKILVWKIRLIRRLKIRWSLITRLVKVHKKRQVGLKYQFRVELLAKMRLCNLKNSWLNLARLWNKSLKKMSSFSSLWTESRLHKGMQSSKSRLWGSLTKFLWCLAQSRWRPQSRRLHAFMSSKLCHSLSVRSLTKLPHQGMRTIQFGWWSFIVLQQTKFWEFSGPSLKSHKCARQLMTKSWSLARLWAVFVSMTWQISNQLLKETSSITKSWSRSKNLSCWQRTIRNYLITRWNRSKINSQCSRSPSKLISLKVISTSQRSGGYHS